VKFQITHTTSYSYSAPVTLEPHILRLRPRSDGWQSLTAFALTVEPTPAGISQVNDLEGNAVIKLWFPDQPVDRLTVQARSELETHCTDPFHYILEPWAGQLPIDYPASIALQLQPYLHRQLMGYAAPLDPVAFQLAQELLQRSAGNVPLFLSELNQQIYGNCQQVIRETGASLPPSITWNQRSGSCRDFSVLFMEVCRAIGLAARFVSGYHQVDPGCEAHLHAWSEVYLPGAGWRGYDPTQGLAVCDRHMALVATALPSQSAPVYGAFRGANSRETMHYDLTVKTIE